MGESRILGLYNEQLRYNAQALGFKRVVKLNKNITREILNY
ncbi:hypothetical protein [Sediminibacillus albus]|uniref:Uncharacterized protein n=1 Tax=Sediminibacillus albus TaxID=407036 RepID=A0A1G8VIJ4_9BACI|nr:hypothetical protein [Sediminibacillus albus]SDJ65892.1 hypothetical protein SAMN05216243_0136 [Sediminibacillus albus]